MTDDIILLNMNCSNCGGVIDPETMTCKSCGTPYLIKTNGKVHILQIEVGDMPRSEVERLMYHYQVALKSALSKETKVMLVPIRNGQGSVTIQTIED
jgi:hypothetical protein